MVEEEEEEEEEGGSCLIHRESRMGREAAAAWLQFGRLLGCKEDRCGGERGRRVSEEGGEVWGESREEDQYLVGQVREERGGERDRERATRSSGHQSIGRFSPCFFVNSSAFFKNFLRSFEYSSARSALRGCSGWGSFTSAMRD